MALHYLCVQTRLEWNLNNNDTDEFIEPGPPAVIAGDPFAENVGTNVYIRRTAYRYPTAFPTQEGVPAFNSYELIDGVWLHPDVDFTMVNMPDGTFVDDPFELPSFYFYRVEWAPGEFTDQATFPNPALGQIVHRFVQPTGSDVDGPPLPLHPTVFFQEGFASVEAYHYYKIFSPSEDDVTRYAFWDGGFFAPTWQYQIYGPVITAMVGSWPPEDVYVIHNGNSYLPIGSKVALNGTGLSITSRVRMPGSSYNDHLGGSVFTLFVYDDAVVIGDDITADVSIPLGIIIEASTQFLSLDICPVLGLGDDQCIVGQTSMPPGIGQILCGQHQPTETTCGMTMSHIYLGIGIDGDIVTTSAAQFLLIADTATFILTGQEATRHMSRLASFAQFILTGMGIGFASHSLAAGVGSFALTGIGATFTHRSMAAGAGTFALSGSATGLAGPGITHALAATPRAYTLTGTTTLLKVTMPAGVGSFTLTGIASFRGPTVTAAAASYSLTGVASLFKVTMPAGTGSFALTGKPVSLAGSLAAFLPTPAAYVLTRNEASLTVGIPAAVSAFTMTGVATGLKVTMPATAASFVLTGKPASLSGSNEPVTAVSAPYILTGSAVTFGVKMPTTVAAYTLTGIGTVRKITMPAGTGVFA